MTVLSAFAFGVTLSSSTIIQVVEIVDVRLNHAFAGKWGRRVTGDIVVRVEGRDITVLIQPFHTRFQGELDLKSGDLVEIKHGLEGDRARIERKQIRRAR